jgi:hypothetical protein
MNEHSEQDLHSGQHISELLDSLIGALYEQRARQRRLYEFKATRRPPRPPQVFEDVNALAEYNKNKTRYERELEAITHQKETSDETVAKLESDVKSVLPVNTAVMHTYGGKESDLQGRYAIRYERSPNELRTRPGDLPGLIRVQRTPGA